MRKAALLLVLVAAGCGGSEQRAAKRACAPTPGAVEAADLASSGTAARVRLGPGMELKATRRNLAAARLGDPLTVTGTVRGEDCAPLKEATIHVWQTNGRGRYGPSTGGRDRCWYTLDTVMPRGYDGGPAHIHMRAGHPDARGLATEVLFGDESNPQSVTVEVRDGTAELDIVLRDSE